MSYYQYCKLQSYFEKIYEFKTLIFITILLLLIVAYIFVQHPNRHIDVQLTKNSSLSLNILMKLRSKDISLATTSINEIRCKQIKSLKFLFKSKHFFIVKKLARHLSKKNINTKNTQFLKIPFDLHRKSPYFGTGRGVKI